MSEYTATTEEVRDSYRFSNKRPDVCGKDFGLEFDHWLAEHERQVAERAWDRCVGEMPIDPDWKNFYTDNNPYRKVVES